MSCLHVSWLNKPCIFINPYEQAKPIIVKDKTIWPDDLDRVVKSTLH